MSDMKENVTGVYRVQTAAGEVIVARQSTTGKAAPAEGKKTKKMKSGLGLALVAFFLTLINYVYQEVVICLLALNYPEKLNVVNEVKELREALTQAGVNQIPTFTATEYYILAAVTVVVALFTLISGIRAIVRYGRCKKAGCAKGGALVFGVLTTILSVGTVFLALTLSLSVLGIFAGLV